MEAANLLKTGVNSHIQDTYRVGCYWIFEAKKEIMLIRRNQPACRAKFVAHALWSCQMFSWYLLKMNSKLNNAFDVTSHFKSTSKCLNFRNTCSDIFLLQLLGINIYM